MEIDRVKYIFTKLLTTRHFLLFLGIVFLVHIGYALSHQIPASVDARAYESIANNLISFGEYRQGIVGSLSMDPSIFKIGPGYEFWLAFIFYVFGSSHFMVWFLQSLMYVISILILSVLVVAIFEKEKDINWKALYMAIVPVAFFIDVVQINAMLLSEPLFLFLETLSIFLFYLWIKSPKVFYTLWLGLVVALLYLVRPTGIVFLIAFGLFMILRKRYYLAFMFLLLFVLIQIPWIYRNYMVYDKVLVTHTTAGAVDLLAGNFGPNHGVYKTDFDLYREIDAPGKDPMLVYAEANQWFNGKVINEPLYILKQWGKKAILFWSPTKTGGFWFHYNSSIEQILTIISSVLFYMFIFGSAIAYLFRRKKYNLFLLSLMLSGVGLLSISIITIISSRYRLTLLPIVVILAAGYWYSERRKISDFIYVGLVFLLAGALDIYLQMDTLVYRLNYLL